ncbi:hypothetical protein ACFL3H_07060 [Gemmatimonadota bacterium]
MPRPEQANTLEEFADMTGIGVWRLERYAFLSSESAHSVTYKGFSYPCLFAYPAERHTTPKHYFRKETKISRKKYVPHIIKYVEGTTTPDKVEEYLRTLDPNVLNKFHIIPLDENIDKITVNFEDYHDCNSNNPKEWHTFRSWKQIDEACTSWCPDKDKWNRFSKLPPVDRARILWLWSQHLNLSTIGATKSRGPKTQHLHKIRIFLITSELEERRIQYKHFWTANYLNIIHRTPYRQINCDNIKGYNPVIYDLETNTKTKTGAEREERAGEAQIRKAWSKINEQIKPLEKIAPSKLSARHVT